VSGRASPVGRPEPSPVEATGIPSCPVCSAAPELHFHSQASVPAHSCVLLESAEDAARFPTGAIDLALCASCGCIWNTAFDRALVRYDEDYEDTQACSPHFRSFARALAGELVERYGIVGKRVVEIGCGKGDFLRLLCELGANRGVGIDPAVEPERTLQPELVELVAGRYPGSHGDVTADLFVCRHTLEHLPDAAALVAAMALGARQSGGALVYVEVPDVARILEEGAFWDVYYEHCCYFGAASLERLAQGAGLLSLDLRTGYDGQYLLLFARPAPAVKAAVVPPGEIERIDAAARRFSHRYEKEADRWNTFLEKMRREGRRVALWGSGSKAVAFLGAVDGTDVVESVVDINPRKQGNYMARVPHRIVAPEHLLDSRPDVVIAMNPVYLDEIGKRLSSLGLDPELLAL